MPSIRVSWPLGYEVEAEEYAEAANAHYSEHYGQGGTFTEVVIDQQGQPNCHYYGAPWSFDEATFDEPSEVAAMRPHGSVTNTWNPPSQDES